MEACRSRCQLGQTLMTTEARTPLLRTGQRLRSLIRRSRLRSQTSCRACWTCRHLAWGTMWALLAQRARWHLQHQQLCLGQAPQSPLSRRGRGPAAGLRSRPNWAPMQALPAAALQQQGQGGQIRAAAVPGRAPLTLLRRSPLRRSQQQNWPSWSNACAALLGCCQSLMQQASPLAYPATKRQAMLPAWICWMMWCYMRCR